MISPLGGFTIVRFTPKEIIPPLPSTVSVTSHGHATMSRSPFHVGSVASGVGKP
jgi:hypothetical protein